MNTVNKIKTQIGPLKVYWAKDIKDDNNNSNMLGVFVPEKYEIAVLNNLPQGIKRQTLLHELIHMLQYNQGLKFNESTADALATGLIHLIDNNPKLVEFLTTK